MLICVCWIKRKSMRKKIQFLTVVICVLFFKGTVYAISYVECCTPSFVDHEPPEMIVLKLSPDLDRGWKEISRYVTEKEGAVECIPSNQHIVNWSELIAIQYFDKSFMNQKATSSIEDAVDLIRETTIDSYPWNKVTWKIVEKNKSDLIYEWILHKPFKSVPPQHVVVRAFLTDTGFHSIGFTRRNKEMTSDERGKWIKTLRDSVFIVSLEEAKNMANGLSIVNKLKDSLNLGVAFKNWKVVGSDMFQNGHAKVTRVPPSYTEGHIVECLEVTTMPTYCPSSVDQLLEAEKRAIQEMACTTVEFSILKKSSPTEIIYSFVYPQGHFKITGVVRTFLADQGYYSIIYKRRLPNVLKPKEILQWKERLEAIKVQKTY